MDPAESRPAQNGNTSRRPLRRQSSQPSIGIFRPNTRPSNADTSIVNPQPLQAANAPTSADFATRRRSSSEPRPPLGLVTSDDGLARSTTRPDAAGHGHMPTLTEEASPIRTSPGLGNIADPLARADTAPSVGDAPENRRRSVAARTLGGLGRLYPGNPARARAGSTASQPEYDPELVNLLDVIDPEVSTLSTLTNVQNSLFVPDLGSLLNRRPTYNLTAIPQRTAGPTIPQKEDELQDAVDESAAAELGEELNIITSRLSQSHYAVLPSGVSLQGWTDEERAHLDDHVRHMLHSRRAAFKRGWKGFGQYIRRPLGFFVTLYATLITVFGFAWVLFLIGWINLGERRDYIINVIDNVLVALFAVVGDGLIPWRIVDTYHMIYIAHYHHLTWRLRREKHLPRLPNHNDLPAEVPSADPDSTTAVANDTNVDLEAAASTASSDSGKAGYHSVLSPAQQRKLEHHQTKFSKSHTFYKPHETETHSAFPLRLLVAVVVLLDFHSIFQIALGVCTWSISYHVRPFALTTVILCCSLTCNITGGVLISIGDRRTRKKEVLEKMFRQKLTEGAIRKVEKERRRTVELQRVGDGADAGDEQEKDSSAEESRTSDGREEQLTREKADIAKDGT